MMKLHDIIGRVGPLLDYDDVCVVVICTETVGFIKRWNYIFGLNLFEKIFIYVYLSD